jgi:CRP-like cAMP-binding protein
MFSTRWALETFIRRLGNLSPLSRDDMAAVSALPAEPVRFRGNVDIVNPGQEFHDACLVVSGLVARFVQLKDGRRQFTAFHMPGDVADIHRLASPLAGSSLQTLSTATIVRIPARQLKAISLASPAIMHAFFAYAALDAAVLAQWAVNVGRRDAQSRMAHFICEIGIRSEHSDLGSRDEFVLDASQAQIGDALGLTSVHVNRTLKALRQSGSIAIDGRIVRILNWPLLSAQGDFDDGYLQLVEQVRAA